MCFVDDRAGGRMGGLVGWWVGWWVDEEEGVDRVEDKQF